MRKDFPLKVLELEEVSATLLKVRIKPYFGEPTFSKMLDEIKPYAIGSSDGWWFIKKSEDTQGDIVSRIDFSIYKYVLDDAQREIADIVMKGGK